MSKHSPGPWRWVDVPGNPWAVRGPNDETDHLGPIILNMGGSADEQEKANARLIASAPEMLDLLRGAVDPWDKSMASPGADWYQRARALLARLDP